MLAKHSEAEALFLLKEGEIICYDLKQRCALCCDKARKKNGKEYIFLSMI